MAHDYTRPASEAELAATKTALEARNFDVQLVENLSQAKTAVLQLIPHGADVYTGTSATLVETGLAEELNESGRYNSARKRYAPLMQAGKILEAKQIGSASDYAVGSVQAITQDGQVVIASASGSQLPNYVYGANHVIWVVGAQKIVTDLNEAIDRVETHALPLEDVRARQVYGEGSEIRKLVIYRKEKIPGRTTIILIKQAVGY